MSDVCNTGYSNTCGCDNGCDTRTNYNTCGCNSGCGNSIGFGGGNDCCSLIWILILLSVCGCGNGFGGRGNNSCLWIILLLFFCGGSGFGGNGCGCNDGCC